ncbi:hypothetical protein ACTXT7_007640 [Hymenolepis weldensis]
MDNLSTFILTQFRRTLLSIFRSQYYYATAGDPLNPSHSQHIVNVDLKLISNQLMIKTIY